MTTTSIRKWWHAKSETFSTLCATDEGETFTHGEVVLMHLYLLALVAACCLAGVMEGGGV